MEREPLQVCVHDEVRVADVFMAEVWTHWPMTSSTGFPRYSEPSFTNASTLNWVPLMPRGPSSTLYFSVTAKAAV